MNNKLSAEILATIMAHLSSSSDKSNCLLVFEAWYQHISQTTWFDTLSLQNSSRIAQARELFTNKPHLGQQVRHLSLLGSDSLVYDGTFLSNIIDLPQLFPNIKTLTFTEETRRISSAVLNRSPSAFKESFKKWNQLTSLTDQLLYIDTTINLLGTRTFAHLKELNISFMSKLEFDIYPHELDNLLTTFIMHLFWKASL